MADNIINLADHRKVPQGRTIEELAVECSEEISGNWERFARNNRLSDYFTQSTPSWSDPKGNYLSDLNALSVIESKINIVMALCSPGSNGASQIGWIASFKLNTVRVETPLMLSEAYARCFNILLFLKLGRELTQAGIPIE